MQVFIIRFPSVTYAQKAQRLLEREGIRSRLTRQGTRGCSYGLEITAPDPTAVLQLFSRQGVIYLSSE